MCMYHGVGVSHPVVIGYVAYAFTQAAFGTPIDQLVHRSINGAVSNASIEGMRCCLPSVDRGSSSVIASLSISSPNARPFLPMFAAAACLPRRPTHPPPTTHAHTQAQHP